MSAAKPRRYCSKHGRMRDHELFGMWRSIKQRCLNPKAKAYKHYGARGITICDRWKSEFWSFVEDMGPRPPRTWIERKNNDGNYEPGNCVWATPKEQANNRRPPKRSAPPVEVRLMRELQR